MLHSAPPAPTRGVAVRSLRATDTARNREFPVEVWYPATPEPNALPLVLFSHHSGGSRRASTFLTTHLAQHGYVVAAMDHSEVVAPELARKQGETPEERAARVEGWIRSRVPDLRFLLDYMLSQPIPEVRLDHDRVGVAGHSFGGWTVLEAPNYDPRIRSVVALAPGGSTIRLPGIIPVTVEFRWTRRIPLLLVAAGQDASLPIDTMREIFDRAPEPKRMVVLERADHMHFVDDVETMHEAFRTMPLPPELAAIQARMRPIAELSSAAEAHGFIRSVTLEHFDASL